MVIIRYILSRKILGFLLIIYFLNYIVQGKLETLFSLEPDAIIHRFEFWRLITYPMSAGSFEAILLLFYSFYVLSPKLEYLFKSGLYPLYVLLLIFLQGLIHTVVFWDKHIILSGMEGISLFTMALFSLLRPKQEIKFTFIRAFKLAYLTLFFFGTWLSLKYLNSFILGSDVMLSAAAALAFGASVALLSFLQIRFINKIIIYKRILTESVEARDEEVVEPAFEAKVKSKHKAPQQKPGIFIEGDQEENEKRLNLILEKIFESGKESLTREELSFLDEYSKKM